MVASSVVLTVVVLNYHHRTSDNYQMPPLVNNNEIIIFIKVIFTFIQKFLLVSIAQILLFRYFYEATNDIFYNVKVFTPVFHLLILMFANIGFFFN